jgi:hypothetical protein
VDRTEEGLTVSEELEEVRVLRLQPGDVVVCTLRRNASHAEFEEIHARLKERFPDNAVTIVSQDAELSVVRPASEVRSGDAQA